MDETVRTRVLRIADHLVSVERDALHGNPDTTLNRVAALWSVYLEGKNFPLSGSDAAMLLVLLKVARQMGNPGHEDSYIDGAGYFALAAELALPREPVDDLV